MKRNNNRFVCCKVVDVQFSDCSHIKKLRDLVGDVGIFPVR